jgi:uncharacterized protein (TIGR00730 family)
MSKFSPPKAYQNIEFLNGPGARSIRILAEFLQPQQQFRREGIKDTIVFFGSARFNSMKSCKKKLIELRLKLNKSKSNHKKLLRLIEDAENDLYMSKYYEYAAKLAKMITEWTHTLNQPFRFVICSGGGPGIMEAANKGVSIAKGRSIGLNISLPFEQESNRFVSKNLSFEFHYFFMRKFWFVYLAKAFIMFPGGFGTLDELMEVLTLLQTKKLKKKVTIILFGKEYWNTIINFKAMVHQRVISKNDLKLFRIVNSVEEAYKFLVSDLIKNYPLETS